MQREGYNAIPDPTNNKSLLIIGGKNNGKFCNQILTVDLSTQKLRPSQIPDLPSTANFVHYFASTTKNEQIYVAGLNDKY